MQVLDHEHQQTLGGEVGQQILRRGVQGEAVHGPTLRLGEAGHEGRHSGGLESQRLAHRSDADLTHERAQQVPGHAVRKRLPGERYAVTEHHNRPVGHARHQVPHEPCLPDPRVALDHGHLGLTQVGSGERGQEQVDLGLPPHRHRAACAHVLMVA